MSVAGNPIVEEPKFRYCKSVCVCVSVSVSVSMFVEEPI